MSFDLKSISKVRAVGKAAVLLANENIFSSVDTIQVSPTSLYCEGNAIVAELKICVDKKTNLLVVDIIEFNEDGKITAIRAYKGN